MNPFVLTFATIDGQSISVLKDSMSLPSGGR